MSSQPDFPRMGIPCQHNDETNTVHHVSLVSQNTAYVRAVTQTGGMPVLISPIMTDDMLRVIYADLHGLLLTGGVDVDPDLYGEPQHPKLGRIDQDSDRVEMQLARWAFDDDLPIFGICRGIQVLNVAMGGTLYQDIESQVGGALRHACTDEPRDWIAHSVQITGASRLAEVMGRTEIAVNSLHHQAINGLSSLFRLVAQALDGIIEGIERRDGAFCLAVQWHPEELVSQAPHKALFQALVDAALERV
jgi:putative glutamine amidotransferase